MATQIGFRRLQGGKVFPFHHGQKPVNFPGLQDVGGHSCGTAGRGCFLAVFSRKVAPDKFPGKQQIGIVVHPGLTVQDFSGPQFPDRPVYGLGAGVQVPGKAQGPQLGQQHDAAGAILQENFKQGPVAVA